MLCYAYVSRDVLHHLPATGASLQGFEDCSAEERGLELDILLLLRLLLLPLPLSPIVLVSIRSESAWIPHKAKQIELFQVRDRRSFLVFIFTVFMRLCDCRMKANLVVATRLGRYQKYTPYPR